jgi:hypothetical protein
MPWDTFSHTPSSCAATKVLVCRRHVEKDGLASTSLVNQLTHAQRLMYWPRSAAQHPKWLVADVLGDRNVMRSHTAQAVWREVLRDLGWNRPSMELPAVMAQTVSR